MVKYKTAIHQFGIISGIRQETSDRLTVVTPGNLFAPEARKGHLLIITEATDDLARGRDACQVVTKTISKVFYNDRSFSVTSGLREAIHKANSALYEYNFRAAHHQKTAVGVTCAVLRGGDLYLGQVQPTQAYIAHAGRLRALPTHPTWNPAASGNLPILPPNSLGSSLFTEPDLRRNPVGPGDMLVFCSTNLSRMLGREEAERLFCYGDAASALETLYTLCKRTGLPEAYAVVIELLPLLSEEARDTPLSPTSVGERGKIAMRTLGGWLTGLTGEAALLFRRPTTHSKDQDNGLEAYVAEEGATQQKTESDPEESGSQMIAGEAQPQEPGRASTAVAPVQQSHAKTSSSPNVEEPLPATAFLGERLPKSATAPQPRTPIDLTDQVPLPVDFAAIPKKQPLPPPTLGEQLTFPFRVVLGIIVTFLAFVLRRNKRPAAAPLPSFEDTGGGLSYRRRRRPLPWRSILLLSGIIILAIIYGQLQFLQRRERDINRAFEQAQAALDRAEQTPDDKAALNHLSDAQRALSQVMASGAITTTDTRWPQFVTIRDSVNSLEASIARLSLLKDLKVVATLPASDTISRLVADPKSGDIYALGEQRKILYRLPAGSQQLVPFFQENTTAVTRKSNAPQTFVWRLDRVVVLDRAEHGSTAYLFNPDSPDNWFYNQLQGSETWPSEKPPDVESWGGNLYIWGAISGQILRYMNGFYADPPTSWLTDSKGQDLSSAIDMAVDGAIYLLSADGRIAVLRKGAFEKWLPKPEVLPGIGIVTRFFASGESSDVGHFYFVEPAADRIIQTTKQTGAMVQQLKAPSHGPQLDRLRDIFVIEPQRPGERPTLYLANGGQILRATIPVPPPTRPRPSSGPAAATPIVRPTPTSTP